MMQCLFQSGNAGRHVVVFSGKGGICSWGDELNTASEFKNSTVVTFDQMCAFYCSYMYQFTKHVN